MFTSVSLDTSLRIPSFLLRNPRTPTIYIILAIIIMATFGNQIYQTSYQFVTRYDMVIQRIKKANVLVLVEKRVTYSYAAFVEVFKIHKSPLPSE